jgi:uncharacterized protein (TIGR03000 family)
MHFGAPAGSFHGSTVAPHAPAGVIYRSPVTPYHLTYPGISSHSFYRPPVYISPYRLYTYRPYGYPYLAYGLGYPFFGGLGYGALGYSPLFGGYGYGGGATAAVTGYPILSPDFYSPEPAPDAVPEVTPSVSGLSRPANVTVIVPEGSEVWFEGNMNSETGTRREYTSPALEPGYTYVLNVKLTPRGGTTRTVKLYVKAGDNLTFDLTK